MSSKMPRTSNAPELAKFIHVYKDKECTNELVVDAAGKPFMTIPKITNAGDEGSTSIYIVNTFKHEFLIDEIDPLDADLNVKPESAVLKPNIPVKLDVKFSPKPNRLEKLDTFFTVRGRFIIS